jgi:Ca2+-binding EF-hand superfamily protein
MSVFASASGLTSGPNTALKRALRELATAPAPGLVSHKKALATRSDEARGQQLRGIFAAFDEDRDGLLNEGELSSALLSLGIDPTPATMARYAKASPLGASAIDFASVSVCGTPLVLSLSLLGKGLHCTLLYRHAGLFLLSPSPHLFLRQSHPSPPLFNHNMRLMRTPLLSFTICPQFLKVCLSRDGDETRLPSTLASVTALLAELDAEKTGRIPLATLLHALAEVHAPTRLSLEEVQELLRLTGILTPATMAEPRMLYAMEVDYRAFVEHLTYTPPPPRK